MFKISKHQFSKPLASLAVLVACFNATHAFSQETTESPFKFSGYVSLVGGRVLNGDVNADYSGPLKVKDIDCPCYVADWSNAGVYGSAFSLSPESRIGIQGKYSISNQSSLTAQIVSRGTKATPDITWAYGSYKFNENFEVQVGRKRIPLYYYSDFQDIGVSYPWITPPPELYGWEATNYNGISVRYNHSFANVNLNASMFGGHEKVKESQYQSLYYPSGKTEVEWNNLIGSDLEVNYGPLTVRGVVMRAEVKNLNNDIANPVDDLAKLQAHGIAVNLDFDKWFVLSEFTHLTRDYYINQYKVMAPALTVGAGMRFGKWTPFVNSARYIEETTDSEQYPALSSYKRTSFTLRYDIDSKTSVKTQIDKSIDVANNFGGNSTVFRVSYDRVF